MSGQSIVDRLTAAKHSIAGQGLAKSVCKATTEEVMGPKKKHLDYLLQCTNEPNVSIPQLANLLIERAQHQNWVVVFKSLVTIHNVMNYGNERLTQYLASNNCSFQLGNFLDKSGVQGYDMSKFIRRYAKYLNEKAVSYRMMAFDFCKVKRGKEDGMLRTMNAEKLLKTLPTLQAQLDALLEFDCSPNDLTNGVINAAFMLLFKDLIRLFACYNDGIINLLEKYFDMNKKQCKEGLDIYKKFIVRMENVSKFLKTAENVGIDKGDIPDLAKAPSSLLDALEQHLQSLEASKKGGPVTVTNRPAGVKTAIDTFATASASASLISDQEKQKILEEESKQLQQLKEQKEKAQVESPQKPAPAEPFGATSPTQSVDLFGAAPVAAAAPAPVAPAPNTGDDLLGLTGASMFNQVAQQAAPQPQQPAFQPQTTTNPFASAAPVQAQPAPGWGAPAPGFGGETTTTASGDGFASEANFAAVFGGAEQKAAGPSIVSQTTQPPPGFDGFGELLQPQTNQPIAAPKQDTKLVKGDLDTSLASLAGNLNINGPGFQVKKGDHQWKPSGEKKLTGGGGFNQPVLSSGPTIQPMNQSFQSHMGGQPMGGGFQQPPMSGFQQPAMGMNAPRPMGMTQQSGFSGQQPMMGGARPPTQTNDPFGAL